MPHQDDSAIIALIALLDEEIEAIRRADFSALDDFAARKEDLLGRLAEQAVTDARTLDLLHRRARRNAAGLAAAARGLRAARHRIAELVQARSGLETYDRNGQRVATARGAEPAGKSRLEHRA